jgi:hypothetical protein
LLEVKATTLAAVLAPAQQYTLLEMPIETHLLLTLDRRSPVGQDGKREMPKPRGMSGCGLWRLSTTGGSSRGGDLLEAILIEYHERSRKVVVGTRARYLLPGFDAYIDGDLV